MADVKLQALIPDDVALGDNFAANSQLHDISSKLAIFSDPASNDYIICNGSGFDYTNGSLTDGTIYSVTVYNSDGKIYGRISGLALEVFSSSPIASVSNLIDYALDGDDVIMGSSADDTIYDREGRDVVNGRGGDDYFFHLTGPDIYTGGKGRDEFAFADTGDRVTITDFSTDGPNSQHDILSTAAERYSLRKSGDDTVVSFSTGVEVTLLKIRPGELDASDIVLL